MCCADPQQVPPGCPQPPCPAWVPPVPPAPLGSGGVCPTAAPPSAPAASPGALELWRNPAGFCLPQLSQPLSPEIVQRAVALCWALVCVCVLTLGVLLCHQGCSGFIWTGCLWGLFFLVPDLFPEGSRDGGVAGSGTSLILVLFCGGGCGGVLGAGLSCDRGLGLSDVFVTGLSTVTSQWLCAGLDLRLWLWGSQGWEEPALLGMGTLWPVVPLDQQGTAHPGSTGEKPLAWEPDLGFGFAFMTCGSSHCAPA